jgi:hypothetical protein
MTSFRKSDYREVIVPKYPQSDFESRELNDYSSMEAI